MCEIVPFPLAARVAFIRRHAEIVANLSVESSARHIAQQAKTQRDALARRGISESLINREIKSLENALRSDVLRECV